MSQVALRPRRSALYMPASNEKAVAKAKTLACDVVILDLEDAVAPDEKPGARDKALKAVLDDDFGDRELVVRINGLDTPWGLDDLQALRRAPPDAVLVPKVSSADDVRACHALVEALPPATQLWVMIETARSIFRLEEIADAAAGTRLSAFVLGTNDLAKETGCRLAPGRAALAGYLGLAVAAARLGGLTVLDGVYNDLENLAGLEAECRQGLEFGFDGKTLIHPNQLDVANATFTPSPDEVAFAREVIAAFSLPENAKRGALRVAGRMVERLHLAQSHRMVAIADVLDASARNQGKVSS